MEGEEDEQLKQWERGNMCFDVENEAINVVAGCNHDLLESDAELGYEEMVKCIQILDPSPSVRCEELNPSVDNLNGVCKPWVLWNKCEEFDAGRREILVVDNVLFQAWWCSGETSNGAANGMADVLSWMSNMSFHRKFVIGFN
ncbi:hypothetical protein J1N35_026823 [Gossypium stocksii]|uniref:Uncharacterized protein n=1 Tax=Gossypium stocksii TaxID=47602 RepID=A0A9D3V9A5_9ROSI|nr:hypothetical protein J1N35_026823 [Gossypium stocksii]